MPEPEPTTTPKRRVITLTDKPPIKIVDADWPSIAHASWHEGQFAFQANRSGWLRVRQHADGRAIVYGRYNTSWEGERDLAGGEFLAAGADIPAAIVRVAETVGAEEIAQECISNLPPVEV